MDHGFPPFPANMPCDVVYGNTFGSKITVILDFCVVFSRQNLLEIFVLYKSIKQF